MMTNPSGLTTKQAKELQQIYGKNEISSKSNWKVTEKILHIVSEPIYLLLFCSAMIYFMLGEQTDGGIMIAFVIFVIGIDVLQDIRTGNALKKLREISAPKIPVIRDGNEMMIPGIDLVPGDIMLVSEGVKIPADGTILSCVGLCIDESILTGESDSVWKHSNSEATLEEINYFRKDYCYTGSLVILGNGTILVDKIGNETEYGKIADKIAEAPKENSLLQNQLQKLAKQCTVIAAVLFLIVSLITFFNLTDYSPLERFIHSMLAGVVLALSMIPAEFPVIQSVFLSMGALRLARKNALVRRLAAVETLGAISVLCMDKTGTITENKMKVQECYVMDRQEGKFCRIMSLACKTGTHDPVEKAMLEYGGQLCSKCVNRIDSVAACDLSLDKPVLIKDYAFTNEQKAMGQVWLENGYYIIAAKGSPESIMNLCFLTREQQLQITHHINLFTKKGLRVIAIADHAITEEEKLPVKLTDCRLYFRGLIGLLDSPREHMEQSISDCYRAGIRIVMITGDHPITAASIASKVGIRNSKEVITGDQITAMSDEELRRKVKNCNLFARVLPIHKMRIVKALKDNGEVVAMTGDGVNDSPALRISNIGISMGKHGSEVCREAADLILLDDNFTTILDTIKDGRRIYQNIIKTIGYVFAIHIPIALISLAAPLLGFGPQSLLLLPLHIVLLELVMDPTCSVALERQPAEDDIMLRKPRNPKDRLLSGEIMLKSSMQGIVIFLASFSFYYILITSDYPAALARTAGFCLLVLSNILLVIVNCSERESIRKILRKIKRDKGIWLVNGFTFLGLMVMIYTPFHHTLEFMPLSLPLFLIAIGGSVIAVLWYEFVKLGYRIRKKRK